MNLRSKPDPRLSPLPVDANPVLKDAFQTYVRALGFMNRWNDTMATPLEEEPVEVGEKHLAKTGWSVGKHRR